MDLPGHVATGAFIGNALLYLDLKSRTRPPTLHELYKLGAASFLVGVLSHLGWDALPHYDWLFYVHLFEPLPYWWAIPQVVTTLPILFFIFHVNRDHRRLAAVSVLGGVYPDLEKLLYLDFHLPRWCTLFRQHSCALTGWMPWELQHKELLIGIEIGVVFVTLALIYVFSQKWRQVWIYHFTSQPPLAREI